MTLPSPWTLRSELRQDRLQKVADWLLQEYFSVLDDLHRPTDSGYGRGCTAFDRQKNRIWLENASGSWEWLGVINPNNDMVFTVGGVPCRFSNDDPQNPTKHAVTGVNRHQLGFQEFSHPGDASRFCFVIDRGLSGSDDPRVEFLGFDRADTMVCRWVSDTPRVLYAESVQDAPEIVVERAPVRPKTDAQESDAPAGEIEASGTPDSTPP
jgi:hypothetical protein